LTADANVLHNGAVQHWMSRNNTVDSVSVTAHGMNLYQKIESEFFNQYKPLVFGEHTIVTPSDTGALFINFALFPGVYQCSGHINISRAREFYINVQSSVIGLPNASGATQSG
jgi:hypothetical protein